MNKLFNLLRITFSLIIILPLTINAQWVKTSSPSGGEISFLGKNGTTVYLSHPSGIYSSTDKGQNWTKQNWNIEARDVISFASNENSIFLGTHMATINRTTDDGVSWSALRLKISGDPVTSLAVDQSNVYALIGSITIYRSTNNGQNWSDISPNLPNVYFRTIKVINSTLFAISTESIIYRSADMGATWTFCSSLESAPILSIDSNSKYLFAGTMKGVYQSSDNGTSWVHAGHDSMQFRVSSIAVNGDTIFAGTTNDPWEKLSGVYMSVNNGKDWCQINDGLASYYISQMMVVGDRVLSGNQGGGVYALTDNGKWVQSNNGLTALNVRLHYIENDKLIALADGGLYYSTNEGADWNHSFLDYNTGNFTCLKKMNNGTFFAGTFGSGLYISIDSGKVWKPLPFSFKTINNVVFSIVSAGQYIFAAIDGQVYRSIDNGSSWVKANNGLPANYPNFNYVNTLCAIDSTVFAAAWYGEGVYRSTDYGNSWTIASDAAFGRPNDLTFATNGKVLYALSSKQLARTDNKGNNWKILTRMDGRIIALSDSLVFLSTPDGIYCSTDYGTRWNKVSSGIGENISLRSLLVAGNYLYAGTGSHGIWKISLKELTTAVQTESGKEIPSRFSLEQNYPNPFNPSTTIRFTIPEASFVQLSVYNSIGQKVADLLSRELNSGKYSAQWNADAFPSGVYYCRIQAGTFSQTRKLLLLK